MKNTLLICTLAFFGLSLFGQTPSIFTDKSHAIGFVATPEFLQPYPGNKWAVAGRGNPQPGKLFSDTLFILIFNQANEVEKRITVQTPIAEVRHFSGFIALPDGSFVIKFDLNLCDASLQPPTIWKINSEGEVLWTLDIQSPIPGTSFLPNKMLIGPDGNLIAFNKTGVAKFDILTGVLIDRRWLFPAQQFEGSDYALIPSTEDFVMVDYLGVQLRKQSSDYYVKENSFNVPVPNSYYPKIVQAGGYFFVVNKNTRHLERFDALLNRTIVSPVPEGIQDLIAGNGGVWLMGRKNHVNWFLGKTISGQTLDSLEMPNRWLSGICVAAKTDALAIAGVDGSGDSNVFYNPLEAPWFECSHLWLRTMSGQNPTPSPEIHGASVRAIEQTAPIQVVPVAPNAQIYNLIDGGFRVEISNHGNQPLERVFVNVRFRKYGGICFTTPVKQLLMTGLNIPPGGSGWVDFGDIFAERQDSVLAEFCFWTSSPNGFADFDHENDRSCLQILTNADEAQSAAKTVRVSPNPASEQVTVELEGGDKILELRLSDLQGSTLALQHSDGFLSSVSMQIADLPSGIFLLEIKTEKGVFARKLIVE